MAVTARNLIDGSVHQAKMASDMGASARSIVKWAIMGLAAVLAVSVSFAAALTIVGAVKQHARSAPVPDLEVEATPERIARGKAVASEI
jgi:hypothetical protein